MARCGSAVVFLVLVCSGSLALAQVVAAPEVVWQDQFGTTRVAAAAGVAVDAAGRAAVAGKTYETPAPGASLGTRADADAFVRVYDAVSDDGGGVR